MSTSTAIRSPRHYRAVKAISVRNGNAEKAAEADALLRASKAARAIQAAVAGAPPLPAEVIDALRDLLEPATQGAS